MEYFIFKMSARGACNFDKGDPNKNKHFKKAYFRKFGTSGSPILENCAREKIISTLRTHCVSKSATMDISLYYLPNDAAKMHP